MAPRVRTRPLQSLFVFPVFNGDSVTAKLVCRKRASQGGTKQLEFTRIWVSYDSRSPHTLKFRICPRCYMTYTVLLCTTAQQFSTKSSPSSHLFSKRACVCSDSLLTSIATCYSVTLRPLAESEGSFLFHTATHVYIENYRKAKQF